MTRKDYEAIAAALASVRPPMDDGPMTPPEKVWTDCCRVLGDVCQGDNPRFDRVRFTKACLS